MTQEYPRIFRMLDEVQELTRFSSDSVCADLLCGISSTRICGALHYFRFRPPGEQLQAAIREAVISLKKDRRRELNTLRAEDIERRTMATLMPVWARFRDAESGIAELLVMHMVAQAAGDLLDGLGEVAIPT